MVKRRATASARPSAHGQAGPHPNARAVYEHVERYLVGALNEPALIEWRLAIGMGFTAGAPLDGILYRMAQLYVADVK